jgi:hypothetical protein
MCSLRRTDLKISRRPSAWGMVRLFVMGARLILAVALLAVCTADRVPLQSLFLIWLRNILRIEFEGTYHCEMRW